MSTIPTRIVWVLTGRDEEKNVKHWERFQSEEEAKDRLRSVIKEKPKLSFSIHEADSIIPDRTMPTQNQQRELFDLIHHAFVALRNLGYGGKSDAVAHLAGVFHNLPHEMFREEIWDWNLLESGLEEFEKRFPDDRIYPFAGMLRRIRKQA